MELQRIILNQNDKNTELYYRHSNIIMLENNVVNLYKNGKISFDTYFNSFSVGKWKKYTNINNLTLALKLKGTVILKIYHAYIFEYILVEEIIKEYYLNNIEIENKFFEIPLFDEGIIYFTLEAKVDSFLYYASYCSNVKFRNKVNIGLAICTYKREKILEKNLKNLLTDIGNDNSEFGDSLKIFISDNASTLSKENENDYVKIYHNMNCGGCGGFTRCMLEIMNYNENTSNIITHIILLDDDAEVNMDTLILTYTFLSILNDTYKEYIISGAMLWKEKTYMQHSAGERFEAGKGVCCHAMYDLKSFEMVVRNEIELGIDYTGWFYCCLPVNLIYKLGLPLPLFVHCDDIEYGLRNNHRFISLNGITVWHPCHEVKAAPLMTYYDNRNLLIILSKHTPHIIKKRKIILKLTRGMIKNIARYNYTEIKLMIRGIEDFCRGIDWLRKTNAEDINTTIRKFIQEKQKIDDTNVKKIIYTFEEIINLNNNQSKWTYLKCLFNWLKPLQDNLIVSNNSKNISLFINIKKFFLIEDEYENGRYFVKNYKELFICSFQYIKCLFIVLFKLSDCVKEYHESSHELESIDFWKSYLRIE